MADPKPSSAASGADKLQFFEGEVRKLESQLTQQKVSYDRQLKEVQTKLEAASAGERPAAVSGSGPSPEQAICTMQVDKLADELNEEVSALAFMQHPESQDQVGKIVSLL